VSAELQGIELTPKRKTFAMLREMGFTDTRRDGENMVAVTLPTYAMIIIPVGNEMIAELEALKK
jgi:hypothetical protein